MERHALAILKQDNLWNWPDTKRILASGKQDSKLKVLDHFWKQFGTCDEKLKQNIESLKEMDFVSAQKSFEVLFRGLDPNNLDFKLVLEMARELFTRLGVTLMNTRGRKSGTSTAFAVSDAICEETNELFRRANEEGEFGKRKQELLKALSFKRDGTLYLLTNWKFMPFHEAGLYPTLAHIIPNSVHGKPDTLKCIAMFAGAAVTDDVVRHLNSIGNVMNMQHDAHTSYDEMQWGIEAKEEGGEVKYIFRVVSATGVPGLITLKEGDEIQFGKGPDGKKLDNGSIAGLCNLQLAVARVLKMSGATDVILEWQDQANDEGCYRLLIASEEFCDMLDAKLLLSGRAMVT